MCFRVFGILDGHGGRQSANFVKAALPTELATQQKLFLEQQHSQSETSGLDEKSEHTIMEQGGHLSSGNGEGRATSFGDTQHSLDEVSDYEMRRVS